MSLTSPPLSLKVPQPPLQPPPAPAPPKTLQELVTYGRPQCATEDGRIGRSQKPSPFQRLHLFAHIHGAQALLGLKGIFFPAKMKP